MSQDERVQGVASPIIVVSGPSGVGKSTVSRLVAEAFDPSVHIEGDALHRFVVNGWIDPLLPESYRQSDVIGAVIGSTALRFAGAGYTTVVDSHMFPDGVEGFASYCLQVDVPLHYAVLRADLATCLDRARGRDGSAATHGAYPEVHARFADMGTYEPHVVGAVDRTAVEIAGTIVEAVQTGELAVHRLQP